VHIFPPGSFMMIFMPIFIRVKVCSVQAGCQGLQGLESLR
jgi:hypothetical protein